jgi:NitT/TauT family transport system substrate-binding protein
MTRKGHLQFTVFAAQNLILNPFRRSRFRDLNRLDELENPAVNPVQTRRRFVTALWAAGTAGLVAGRVSSVDAQAAPETTRIRLVHDPSICVTPQYLAEELLRADGFSEVQYVEAPDGLGARLVAAGSADVMMEFAGVYVSRIDAGDPIVVLGGVHIGCFEVFGGARVRALRDLKGKRVAVLGDGSPEHMFLSSVVAYVGLDPRRDIRWEWHPPEESMRLLSEDQIDAFAGFPPVPQEVRARKIGHLLLSTTTDRPWSQYFCCMVGAHRDFVRKNPVATKRILRAILKSADLCASDPERAARFIVSRGYSGQLDYAVQAIREIPYTRWRDYDPEDTIRFHAPRLREVGMTKSDAKRIIAQGTDWRFFNELKRELKG